LELSVTEPGFTVIGMRKNLLSSRLISKNLKLKIYKTVILPVVLYGCETITLNLLFDAVLTNAFEKPSLNK
jgi:hypothetical protein